MSTARRGTSALVAAFGISIATAVAYRVIPSVIYSYDTTLIVSTYRGVSVLGMLGTLLLIIGCLGLRGGAPANARGFIGAVVALAAVHLVFHVLSFANVPLPSIAHDLFQLGVGFGMPILIWIALARVRGHKASASPVEVFGALMLLELIAAVFFRTNDPEHTHLAAWMFSAVNWAELAASVGVDALFISRVRALRPVVAEGAEALGAALPSLAPASPGNDILVGALWLGGGVVVTVLSYSTASSVPGGGHYVVATGAIAFGLVRLIRGLSR